jgi:3-methylcrotonyl-CoA carboxylase alpha subunit
VTEAITGHDLVEWQLLVASGQPLPADQADLRIHGHAIEARICAENPDNNFLPATGTLRTYHQPSSSRFAPTDNGVRIDEGVRQGDTISPFYDSMVAKLIVHGDTRAEALARLDEALAQIHIVGLSTNVQFLRRVVTSPSFAQGNLDTALIPREEAVLFNQEPLGAPLVAAAAISHTLLNERTSESADPFSRRDGWRSHGIHVRNFDFMFHGENVKAALSYLHDGALSLSVLGAQGVLSFKAVAGGIDIQYTGARHTVQVVRDGDMFHVFAPHGASQATLIDPLAHAGDTQAEGGRLTAPMPGKVVSFSVKAGDKVIKGQALAVMEAMKMEHTIAAPADGTVAELLFAPGDQVAEGAELLRLGTML